MRTSNQLQQQARNITRYLSTSASASTSTKLKPSFNNNKTSKQLALFLTTAGVASYTIHQSKQTSTSTHFAKCAAYTNNMIKTGGDVVMLGPTKEKATGILFPNLCNAMTFVGCGVRVKYGFVKVYAVGTYMDPIAMSGVKAYPTEIEKALLNPTFPRTIRIVMNRSLSIEKYTAAIVEALEPRMNGVDMDKLEEFKKMNPKVDLVQGAEMEMTIRGNVMLYKNAMGGVGQIHSRAFCEALCDVYYGKDPVSPGHREMVMEGIQKL